MEYDGRVLTPVVNCNCEAGAPTIAGAPDSAEQIRGRASQRDLHHNSPMKHRVLPAVFLASLTFASASSAQPARPLMPIEFARSAEFLNSIGSSRRGG